MSACTRAYADAAATLLLLLLALSWRHGEGASLAPAATNQQCHWRLLQAKRTCRAGEEQWYAGGSSGA